MSRWATRWTEAQKRAIVRAAVDGDMSAPAAVKAAKAGKLPGVKAFDMPVSTARDLCQKERRRRREAADESRAVEDPRAAAQDMVTKLLGNANGLLRRMRSGDRETAQEWEDLRIAARAVRELEAAARAVNRDTPPKPAGDTSDDPDDNPQGFLATLAQQDAETPTAGPSSSTLQETEGGQSEPLATPTENTSTAHNTNTPPAQSTKNGFRVGTDESSMAREEAAARVREVLGSGV